MATLQHAPNLYPDVVQAGVYEVQINTGTYTTPVWVDIYGLTDWSPSTALTNEDATTIHDDGWQRKAGVGGSASVACEGLMRGSFDPTTGAFTRDPGQAALIAAGEDFGQEVDIRYWRRDGVPIAKRIQGISSVSDKGGKPGTAAKFSGSIEVNGKPEDIVKPTSAFTVSVGGASAGSFVLTYGGKTTATIAYNANAAAVKAALVALDDGLLAADWDVVAAGADWVVTTPGGTLTGTGTGLTGGAFSITN
ncbi:phage tail tube protein [Gordonia sp. NPDC003376]